MTSRLLIQRTCRCGVEFMPDSPKNGGRYRYCSAECALAEKVKRFKAIPQEQKNAYARKYRADGYYRTRRFVAYYRAIEYLGGVCIDCGYKDNLNALQFDHVRGKTKSVGEYFDGSWEKLREELDRCELRCANCHAIVTAKRRNNGKA